MAKRTVKREDSLSALFAYSTTANSATRESRTKLLMARELKTCMPVLQAMLEPELPYFDPVSIKDTQYKQQAKFFLGRHRRAYAFAPVYDSKLIMKKLESICSAMY